MAIDLILKGGRIIDPSQHLDAVADIGFASGKVAAIGPGLAADAGAEVRDVSGLIVTPGIFAYSKTVMVGESEELRLMAPSEAVEVADANRDVIVGIMVRVGQRASGRSGTAPLDIALQAAAEAGMPLMCHIDIPPPSYEGVLERLRPGDVLTHAFRPFPNAPIDHQGKIKDAVLRARQRGVKFDIGHGKGSFAFKTARGMLANGFYPDTISSDVHALCINGPAFDQVTTLSKFLCMGMPLGDVIAATTVNAAMALKRPELGTLKVGSVGDATILSVKRGEFDYVDVVGEHMTGDKRIFSEGVVIAGRWWHPRDRSKFRAHVTMTQGRPLWSPA